ncbi:hypothetical protein [Streptomyces sp. MS2.AVA.5]|uniref:Uncharacterized protein n=1 Tax=Streptomyces achmelvichensis TaxID=3134111 RepID=A0ACC6Q8N3_9ACTN
MSKRKAVPVTSRAPRHGRPGSPRRMMYATTPTMPMATAGVAQLSGSTSRRSA